MLTSFTGKYVFVGMFPFVARVFEAKYKHLGPTMRGKVTSFEALKRTGDALAQASLAPESDRAAIAREALAWRDATALALEAIEAALAEVYPAIGLEVPEASETRVIRGTKHLREYVRRGPEGVGE